LFAASQSCSLTEKQKRKVGTYFFRPERREPLDLDLAIPLNDMPLKRNPRDQTVEDSFVHQVVNS
jgi:hypothetical protein